MKAIFTKRLISICTISWLLTFPNSLLAAPLFLDFEQPASEITAVARANGITLAPYISSGCGQCNNTNHVLAGGNIGNDETFLQFSITPAAKVKKVSLTIGEWYAPETWAQEQAGNLRVRYQTTTGFTSEAVYPYPITPIVITIDAAANGYLSYIGTKMENKPYVPWMDNVTFFREGDEEKVKLTIKQMRVGQRVFEPSATNGASTDLVTNKPYAVEVTLSATVPNQHKELLARADLFVNGIHHLSSTPFKIGDIVNGQSKAFIFSEEEIPGSKALEIRVVPVTPAAGVFENTDGAAATKTVNFHETNLSLLVSEITGCAPLVTKCFSPPTASERALFDGSQVGMANDILPITGGRLDVTNGINWTFSNPDDSFDSIYRDYAFIWFQKKVTFKDLGVGLVGENYFQFQGFQDQEQQTYGLFLPDLPGVIFLRGADPSTLTHEILHPFAFSDRHSVEEKVTGVGNGPEEIWASGHALDPAIELGPLAHNVFAPSAPPKDAAAFNVGQIEYNEMFKSLLTKKIDPKVVLVTGTLDSKDQPTYFETRRGESFLDPEPLQPNILIEALDSKGTVVSKVKSKASNIIEVIQGSGPAKSIATNRFFFTATLPDDGTVASIRLTKDGKVAFTSPVDKLTLSAAINGLTLDSLKLKKPLSKAALHFIQHQFSMYLKFKTKNPKAARVHLLLVKESIKISLKDSFILNDGTSVNKKTIVDLIDQALSSK